MKLKKRTLGRTGLEVSEVSFGAIPIQRLSEEEAVKVVRAAYEAGINFFDTARGYTTSERRVGLALKDVRNKVYIATKGMVTTRQEAERDFSTSLNEFQMDYVDLYQIHNVRNKERLEKVLAPGGALEYLKEQREKGKIRFIGVTSHNPELLIEAIKTGEFDTVMVPFNFIERQAEKLIKFAEEKNIGIIIMKPFAGGAIPDKNNLKFILQYPVSAVIPGMESEKQIKENTEAANNPLTEEEKQGLEEESKKIGKHLCRRCGYCMPCPQGIDIVMVNTFNRMYEWMNMKETAKLRYAALEVKADACTECGQCEQKCPYNLPVIEMMKKAHKNLSS